MNVLITGGLGFIGSNFIERLIQQDKNYKITNIDAEFYGSNKNNLIKIKKNLNYKFVKGNIVDKKLLDKLIENNDVVINFAAESFVDRSISNAEPFLESNVKGTFTILEGIKKHKKKLIHISTDEVFGSLPSENATEKYPFNPSSPYAATKASAEMLVNSYAITYDCDCMLTRCTNNYGPKQFPEKLIPKTIILGLKGKKIPVYGNGKNIRDWLFVTDHCDAIMKVLQVGKKGESYNISANNELTNLEIIRKILSILDKSEELIEFVEDRPGHDLRYGMDSSKIRNDLSWKEKISFDKGIEMTVKWYLNNSKWWSNLNSITENQTPWKN